MSTTVKRASVAGVLVAALVAAGGGTAWARGHMAGDAKKKPTAVSVVLADTAGTAGPMTMTVTPASVPAGKVKFTVENNGTVIHEMVVIKTKKAFDGMPVGANHRMSEAASVGEVGGLGKGKTKSKTFKLKAGSYILVCNIAKHYEMGMRAAFTVT